MPRAPEMNILDGQVGCYQELEARRNLQYGTVIADPKFHPGTYRLGGSPAKTLDQLSLWSNHPDLTISKKAT
jgi:hypothetical protein